MEQYGELDYGFNEKWEERWKDVVSKDFDYDSDFLIKLINHKLKLMIDHYGTVEPGEYLNETGLDTIKKSLNDCYQLGEKTLSYNYGKEADDYMEYLDLNVGSRVWLFDAEHSVERLQLEELSDKATSDRAKDIKNFFMMLSKYVPVWWG